jgi:hypothetical protein
MAPGAQLCARTIAKAPININESKIFFMLQGFVGRFMDPFLNK